MFRVRSRIAVVHPTTTTLILRSNPGRRVMFGVIAAVLIVAFALGVDWQTDLQRDSLMGTLFYFSLLLICTAVAAWGSSVRFDSEREKITFTKTLAGVKVRQEQIDSSAVRAVTVAGIRFLKEAERPQPGLLNNRFRSYVDRRNTYYKLYLDLDESRHFLEDSTDLTDLDAAANEIAGFLQVTLRREEL